MGNSTQRVSGGRTLFLASGEKLAFVWASVGALIVSAVSSYAVPQTQPAFEVASIRPGNPPFSNYRRFDPGGSQFIAENYTLKELILRAYDLKDFQLSGGPGWIDSSRWDIRAKSEGFTGADQRWMTLQMRRLQTLFHDRFKLAVHRETRELPIYVLTVAKGGPKLQRPNCIPDPDPQHPAMPVPGKMPTHCGAGLLGLGGGLIHASSESMTEFAEALSHFVSRTVVDKTGLSGKFRFLLSFVPDETMPAVPLAFSFDPTDRPPTSDGPGLVTAVQEQLGLKLESSKGPVEVLVIDHVEQPSPN
jgi:uncharacterized protein (TIGR03435 family)